MTNTQVQAPQKWLHVLLFMALLFFFVISGACALLYQVVWTRKLILLFGTTAYAVSTVLFIFFLGLAIGSFIGGRLSEKTSRPLGLYGIFEIIIGLWALGFIVFIGVTEEWVCALLRLFAFSRPIGILFRGILALLFLLVPTVLMGMTLPLLSKTAAESHKVLALRIGGLYTANTFGAVIGCLLAGFVLIPALGYTRAVLLGTTANTLIGVAALLLQRLLAPHSIFQPSATKSIQLPQSSPSSSNNLGYVVVLVYAVAGFCSLALEVLWTRLLVIILIGTTYAFTTMLAALLTGLAFGSALGTAIADRTRRHMFWFGVIETAAGIGCIATLLLFAHAPERYEQMLFEAGRAWEAMTRAKFSLSFSILLVPTLLFGMAFPFAVKAYVGARRHWGKDVGILYGANTIGGLLGSLAGGFVLIPMLGTHRGILLLGSAVSLAGIFAIIMAKERKPIPAFLSGIVIAIGLVVFTYAYQGDVGKSLTQSRLPEDNVLLHYQEGVEGTVAVSQEKAESPHGNRVLWINGVQATASIERGVKMNRFQGILPFLFENAPQEVLLMCFGSGITCGMLAQGPVNHIDAVEISKDVIDVCPFFSIDNLDVFKNPRVSFIIDDGRNFLLTTQKHYDLITFEPMPLALAGVSTFYTKEYYELCLRKLTENGFVSQWVPLHSLNPEIIQSLIRTFISVFPEYCAWFINADLFLIGSSKPLFINPYLAAARLNDPGLKSALAEIQMDDLIELLSSFFLDKTNLQEFAATGRIMVDDRPWAEFEAPKLMYQNTVHESLQKLLPYWEKSQLPLRIPTDNELDYKDFSETLGRRRSARRVFLDGLIAFYSGPVSEPEKKFMEALQMDPADRTSLYYLLLTIERKTELHIRWESFDEGLQLIETALKVAPQEPALYLYQGDLYLAKGEYDAANSAYKKYQQMGGPAFRLEKRLQHLKEKMQTSQT